ncbi:MAG: type II toxin-antitoxin system RelE/ParE family toxin [Alphaproteobacteria bacterium]|nr:type II toxin-antitoxin system RelE/ParE family toxin [Alphaproteobacteria bacterium]
MVKILQKPTFKRAVKRLKSNQKADLDEAVRDIVKTPDVGDMKIGELSSVRVYKFKMAKQLTLLAYTEDEDAITLLALGSHENFYRNLKRN